MTREGIGFKILKIKFNDSITSCHDIFVKEHLVRDQSEETPGDRTLFVLNVPPWASETSIKQVFSKAGSISKIIFKKNPSDLSSDLVTGFKIAYVVFDKPLGLVKALKLTKLETLNYNSICSCGLNKYMKDYNESVSETTEYLQMKIDNFMTGYDKKIKINKKEELAAGVENDEGWTVVTKHGRNPGLSRKQAVENKIKDKIERSKKKRELKNFYTFQIRQSKMKHLANLRQKFEEDKKKINTLKQARKFKPF